MLLSEMQLTQFDIDRFWENVEKKSPEQCWEWLGSRNAGYGCFKVKRQGKLVRTGAHRLMYQLEFGEIPGSKYDADMVVRHKCNNPICVNPAHLTIGTHAQNVRDRVEARRSAIGESNGRSKLTETSVKLIRECLSLGLSPAYLARVCQVDRATIAGIRDGKKWREVA